MLESFNITIFEYDKKKSSKRRRKKIHKF